jgi:hypothetical protein
VNKLAPGTLKYVDTTMNGILITEPGLSATEYMELFGGYNIDEIK